MATWGDTNHQVPHSQISGNPKFLKNFGPKNNTLHFKDMFDEYFHSVFTIVFLA
jgi:hypothetical protein